MSGIDQNENVSYDGKTTESFGSNTGDIDSSFKTRELVELKHEQLFLLEVLVNTVEVHKELSQAKVTKDHDFPSVIVKIIFLHFPSIDICQDDFLNLDNDANKEEDDPNLTKIIVSDISYQPTTPSTAGSSVDPLQLYNLTDQTKATKSDKSVSSKDSQKSKTDRNSKVVGKSDVGKVKRTPSKSIPFATGKSCLFPMAAEELIKQIQRHPVVLNVYRKSPTKEEVLIGQSKVKLGQEFEDAILKSVYNINLPLPIVATIESDCKLRYPTSGDPTGRINIFIRLSCFGASIVTGFHSPDDGNEGYIFKTSKKDQAVEAQKKKGSFFFNKSPYKKEIVVKSLDTHYISPMGQLICKDVKEETVPIKSQYTSATSSRLTDTRRVTNENKFLSSNEITGHLSLPPNMKYTGGTVLSKGPQKFINENKCLDASNPYSSEKAAPWRKYLKECCWNSPDTTRNKPEYCGCADQSKLPLYIDQAQMCDVPPCPLPNCDCYSAIPSKREEGKSHLLNKFGDVSAKHNVPLQLCWNQTLDTNRYDSGAAACPDCRMSLPNSRISANNTRTGGVAPTGTDCRMSLPNTSQRSANNSRQTNCKINCCPCSESNKNQTKTCAGLKDNCFFIDSLKKEKHKLQEEQNCNQFDSSKGNAGYNNRICSNFCDGKRGLGSAGVATGVGGVTIKRNSDMTPNQAGQNKNKNLTDLAKDCKSGVEPRSGTLLSIHMGNSTNPTEELNKSATEEETINTRPPEKGGGGDTVGSEITTDQRQASKEKIEEWNNAYIMDDKKAEDLREGPKEQKKKLSKQLVKHKVKVDSERKSNAEKEQMKKKKKFRSIFYYSNGVYPGINIGHRHCSKELGPVPKTMGWLWNLEDLGDNLRTRRGWRPGAINRAINKMIRQVKMAAGLLPKQDNKAKKVVKEMKRGKRPFTPRSGGLSNAISEEYNTLPQPPTLHVHKKDGAYYIEMNPLKTDSEDEEDERCPLMFKILPHDDEASSTSESSIEIEFTAPGAFRRKLQKPNMETTDTQYSEPDSQTEILPPQLQKDKKGAANKKGIVSNPPSTMVTTAKDKKTDTDQVQMSKPKK